MKTPTNRPALAVVARDGVSRPCAYEVGGPSHEVEGIQTFHAAIPPAAHARYIEVEVEILSDYTCRARVFSRALT